MPLRLTSYPPEGAASTCLWRSRDELRIGRAAGCGWRLDHRSISRLHARLVLDGDGWVLHDAGSKNGTFLEGERVTEQVRLEGPTWLRFGDVHCEFALLDEVAAARMEQRGARHRATAQLCTERIERLTALPDLLGECLRAIVDIAGCERGFVLLGGEGGLLVRASHGLAPAELQSRAFLGSAGAALRAWREREPVVVHDAGADASLGARASVLAGGLRAIVCLPLVAGGEVIGLAYADSRQPGIAIDAIELDLLRAFADRAAMWIAARRLDDSLLQLAAKLPPSWDEAFGTGTPVAAA